MSDLQAMVDEFFVNFGPNADVMQPRFLARLAALIRTAQAEALREAGRIAWPYPADAHIDPSTHEEAIEMAAAAAIARSIRARADEVSRG